MDTPTQKIYGIFYKGLLLKPNIVKQFNKKYGATGETLQGWRPPKKLYDSIGRARGAMKFLPATLRQECKIFEFQAVREVSSEKIQT